MLFDTSVLHTFVLPTLSSEVKFGVGSLAWVKQQHWQPKAYVEAFPTPC